MVTILNIQLNAMTADLCHLRRSAIRMPEIEYGRIIVMTKMFVVIEMSG
jgi:hypothetical protein